MSSIENKQRYSDDELKEFEILISEKLAQANKELQYIKDTLTKRNDQGTEATAGSNKSLEDGADNLEKENLTQLAARLLKFINQMELAMIRIRNKTYGICIDTGKLIPKERLKLVPHTQHTIEAKQKRG